MYFNDLLFKFYTKSLTGRDCAALESHTCFIKLSQFPSDLSEEVTSDVILWGFAVVPSE